MDRREFLKKAGLTPIALASLPMLAETAQAGGRQTGFRFVSISAAATIDGVAHRLAMSGDGGITPEGVEGAGSFVHFDANAPATPENVIGAGTWKAKRLVSFTQIGTWGPLVAGIAEMVVNLVPTVPAGAGVMKGVALKVVCNLAPAGILTGQAEGYTLTIPGAPFGPFTPLTGLTVFTKLPEQRG